MEKIEITRLLSSAKVENIEKGKILLLLTGLILKLYKLTGLNNSMTMLAMEDQASFVSDEIAKELYSDKAFKGIRVEELDYCFMAGVKGRLGDVRTFGINYQTLFRWLDAYVHSSERKKAIDSYVLSLNHKQLTAETELSGPEKDKITRDGINESYKEYLSKTDSAIIPGTVGAIYEKKGKCKSEVLDLGGAMTAYLKRTGIMKKDSTLSDYYSECKKKKMKTIF